ncbi:unnamed protein product [Lymnaea stagnalis]|uniref:G-protein coupled receptors family 1 profile domain-containing protein n=1 Tax=Lymnaea stagnalis TaxID=6523 RepID=A0AAV2IL99_LYMST
MTILSLAVGDVFVALFPMVVFTRIWFGDYGTEKEIYDTNLFYTSKIYQAYLITFVYGLGLMVLGLEMDLHHRISSLSKNSKIICSMMASCAPWILGLSIILPLGLANIGVEAWRFANSTYAIKVLLVIGIILPACGAVMTSLMTSILVINCTPRAPGQRTVSNEPQVIVTLQSDSTAGMNAPIVKQKELIPTAPGNPSQQPVMAVVPNFIEQEKDPNAQQTFLRLNIPPTTQRCAIPAQPNDTPDYKHPGNGASFTTSMTPVVKSVEDKPKSTQRPARLMLISVVYFILVSPFAIFSLGINLNLNSLGLPFGEVPDIMYIVYWLSVMRSAVTPLIVYGYSDD